MPPVHINRQFRLPTTGKQQYWGSRDIPFPITQKDHRMISNYFQKRLSFKLNKTSSEAPEEVKSGNILKTFRKTTKTQFQIFIVNFQTTFLDIKSKIREYTKTIQHLLSLKQLKKSRKSQYQF